MVRVAARKVAAVPADTFATYLDTANEPTRAGLLRTARPEPGLRGGVSFFIGASVVPTLLVSRNLSPDPVGFAQVDCASVYVSVP